MREGTLKVLMIGRATLDSSPGGDSVQLYSTAKYLRLVGVEVDVHLSNESIKYEKYDIIHFFNIIRPDDILSHIKRTTLPFVISTIFVDYSEFERLNRKGLQGIITRSFSGDNLEYLKAIARYFLNGDKIQSRYYLLNGHKASVNYVSLKSKALLPNSHSEYQRFIEKYKSNKNYRKIPNAIDLSVFDDFVTPNEKFRDHIICVGRIEGRKNQLNLLIALSNTDYKVTLIGQQSPNHKAYYEECLRIIESNPNFRIINHIGHSELSSIYKAAKVHVLASWFETTGLSSLEAAAMGCNIVVSRKGDTEEYFEDMAFYCDPGDISSIRSQVDAAFVSGFNITLRQKIRREYTWARAAEDTYSAYKSVLS
ncbi:MAG TPA: glycosyltransferase family 4 protein [Pedobacter sp.]|jgi:glycosyltransferase involved in cell wall biosynthesis